LDDGLNPVGLRSPYVGQQAARFLAVGREPSVADSRKDHAPWIHRWWARMGWGSVGKIQPMQRDDALRLLRERREQLHALGVGQLFLYGSVARNEAREDSDVDLLVE
jgi:Nucleotidyltransferase domain